jgi:proline iminopeptidase
MKLMIIFSVILVIAIAFLFFFFSSPGPVYRPGNVRNKPESFFIPAGTVGRTGYWNVQTGIELYYFTDGPVTGKPVLVLHGGPGYPENGPWKGLSLLNEKYRFFYYHQRGCGKSTRPFDRFKSGNYYQNMMALTDRLGIVAQIADIERIRRILKEDRLILIGHSFGGFTAALYACEFPDKVKKIVLVAPADVFKMPPPDGGLYERIKKYLPAGKPLQDYNDYLSRFFDYGNLFNHDEKELAALNIEFATYYFEALKKEGLSLDTGTAIEDVGGWITPAIFLSLGRTYDIRKALTNIQCPIMLIYGDRDITVTKSSIESYRDNIKECSVNIIAGAGHHCFEEKEEEFAGIINEFLK